MKLHFSAKWLWIFNTMIFSGEKLKVSYQMNFAIRVRDLSSGGENIF